MKQMVIPFLIFFSLSFVLRSQDIAVTRISDDVLVLHPKVIDNMTIVRKVGGNMTAVRTDDGIVVIDSFTSLQAGQNARVLIQAHFPDVPISYLINTHHHSDHVGGNQSFQDACVVAHINLAKYVSAPPSIQITSDAILSLNDKTFEILYFGAAHTNNDLVILDREDRLLIMGDLLCYRKCYIMNSESDAENWIALLDELIDRRSEYEDVIPGHGGVVVSAEALIEQREYLQDICDEVKNARHRNLSLDQAKEEVRLEKYKKYIYYDRIGLDIEAYWKQIEKKRQK